MTTSSLNTKSGQNINISPSVDAGVERLISRFPGWDTQITGLVREDSDFREVCEDYEEVAQALDRWQLKAGPNVDRMIEEYERLLLALEAEALSCLQKYASR